MTPPAWVELPDPGTGPGLRLVLPYPPSANAYWRIVPKRGLVPSDEAKRYKLVVSLMLIRCRALMGELVVSGTVYRPQASGDLGNRMKVLEDALQGLAYLDDGQIAEYRSLRRDVDRANPRVELEIWGERWATRAEVEEHREEKRAANAQRKKTTAANRALKRLAR